MVRSIGSLWRKETKRGWRILLGLVVLAIAGSSTFLITWRRAAEESLRRADTGSPYKNTRLGVKYVGDAACARCHSEIAETFRRHPMGRSLVPVTAAHMRVDEAGDRLLFEAHGLQYSVGNRDGHLIHKETRRDANGRIIARNEAEVRCAVGSGTRGVGYLVERDGFLFQSPISWYTQARQWDLAPGYSESQGHFDRPITSSCLYCHANRVEPVPGTVNRFRPPIFRGHAIGCERCHGPGELHIAHAAAGGDIDLTIVNPARLEPSLREAVCQQCHLNGEWRVVRLDRREEDFRPGLPFYRFWTVLEWVGNGAEDRVVGQFEQMRESRCYLASGGRLECISCHDPHRIPEPEEKGDYFRGRCLECHADRGCSLPASTRLGRSPKDECVTCHMPRRGADVIHVAATNHRIPRRPDEGARPPIRAADPRRGQRPIANFHDNLLDDRERADAERDVGVGLSRSGREGATMALPLLEAALTARSGDAIAWEAKGFALGLLGRGKEALAAFRKALTIEPDRETTLTGAAYAAAQSGQPEAAIEYWRRAIAINPWRSEYHTDLALLCYRTRDWRAAAEACRATLRLNAANVELRKLLVRCEVRLGNSQAARHEFETLLGFELPDRKELLREFAPLVRPR
jgi:hypothetical protein